MPISAIARQTRPCYKTGRSENKSFIRETEGFATFVKNEKGEVTEAVIELGGRTIRAKKKTEGTAGVSHGESTWRRRPIRARDFHPARVSITNCYRSVPVS
jgi:hypothetical protein